MNNMGQIPLLRLVIPLFLGIITWLITGIGIPWYLFFLLYSAWLLFFIASHYFSRYSYSRRWIAGILIQVILFMAGYHHSQNYYQLTWPDHFSRWEGYSGYLKLQVVEPPSEKPNSYQLVCSVKQFMNDSIKFDAKGRLMVYVQKDSAAAIVKYGDILVVRNNFKKLQPPHNPGQFDYSSFMAHRNIFHWSYFPTNQWYLTGNNNGNRVIAKSLEIRNIALNILRKNHLSGKEFAIVSSLLLGYREELDETLQQEFAGAGAMHILCVSGLHVGIIFLLLKSFLGFVKRIRHGILIQTFIIILLIWVYASITGFSPSVMRASAMFSFVALGQSFRRSTNVYNTLAGSALILILINPYIITHIGFQLSFLAVASIVALQPLIYKKIYFKNYVADKAWAIISVSIAAQLATGPLAVFYFNQFPNYFILTNLAVIPLASIIIFTALLTLVFSPVPFLGMVLAKLLFAFSNAMHTSVSYIEGLPFSVSLGVYITLPEMIIIFCILVSVYLMVILSLRKYMVFALGFILLLSASVSARTMQNADLKKVVVYNVSNGLAIDFISDRRCVFLCCPSIKENPRQVEINIADHRLRNGVMQPDKWLSLQEDETINNGWLFRHGGFINFYGTTFFILDNDLKLPPGPANGMPVNYLIVSQNTRADPEQAIKLFQPGLIIFDTSNSFWNLNKWKTVCDQLEVDYWQVGSEGAFTITK